MLSILRSDVTIFSLSPLYRNLQSRRERIKNRWRRRFCHRVPAGCFEGLSDFNAFVSGDSNVGDAMNAKYGHQQGYNGGFLKPEVVQNQQFRPWRPFPPRFRAGPPPKSADHRNWIFAASQPTPDCERFKVLSYNILADYLAWEHQSNLYFHIPSHILAWEWRKRRLFIEFGLWSPDIMCLQEVDKFPDLEVELAIRGYAGIWKMRTGNATDGCAIFWRTNRFQLKHEEHIEFNKLGLRNNVAQLCVFESNLGNRCGNATWLARDNTPTGANQVVVCNTHVLYNPKRGEIKLGQVRTLLDRAFAISRAWNDAPVIVCGDFNSIPMSPLYKFIATQKLNLAGLSRDQISGQSSGTESRWPNSGNGPYRPQASGRCASESISNAQQNYFKTQENVQSDIGSASPIEESVVTQYADIEQESNEQISSNITMKLEAENAGHQAEVSLTYPLPANLSSRTFEIYSQQSNILVNRDAVKNSEEAQKNILYEASSGRDTISPVSGDSADETKLTSTLCMDNSATSCSRSNGAFQSYLTDNNNFGNAAFYHGSRVDFSSMSEKIDALPKEKPCAFSETSIVPIVDAAAKKSSAVSVVEENAGSLITSHNSGKADGLNTCIFDGLIVHVSDRTGVASCIEAETLVENMNSGRDGKIFASGNILQENPAHCDNLSTDVTLTKNCQFSEQSCIKVNEENELSELNGLQENADTNFFKELLGMEDDDQTTKDFNLPNLELQEVSTYHPDGCVSKVARHLVKPFCWSPMEIEIASGKQNCTVVEHPLKLRSVYSDVEDYAGTKDSNREPRVTSYNQKFMGTVDYIWCSEGLQTVKVLDTIPKHILRRTPGFPTQKWGSDHIALACELAFPKGSHCK